MGGQVLEVGKKLPGELATLRGHYTDDETRIRSGRRLTATSHASRYPTHEELAAESDEKAQMVIVENLDSKDKGKRK